MKEFAKVLMQNDVAEHVFYHEWIGGGNNRRKTHYYITRGSVNGITSGRPSEERGIGWMDWLMDGWMDRCWLIDWLIGAFFERGRQRATAVRLYSTCGETWDNWDSGVSSAVLPSKRLRDSI